jgi:hypothetical protein
VHGLTLFAALGLGNTRFTDADVVAGGRGIEQEGGKAGFL